MNIPYEAVGFPPPIGSGSLIVTWSELVWAAITYGKSSSCYHLKYPGYSMKEKIYRTYFLYSCLTQKRALLHKSDLYKGMDQSEKGYASYFLGMTLTKLLSNRLLGIPLLWHVSAASEAISFAPGRSRPDLIGYALKLNKWIVAEAKGRSGKFDSLALSGAKDQSRMITTINGQVPILRFGSESYFSPYLCIKMEDPPALREATPVEFDINLALAEYYSIFPLIKERGAKENIFGINYLIIYDGDLGVSIGLPAEFNMPTSKSGFPALEVIQSIDSSSSQFEHIGADGFFIRLDSRWSEQEMMKEPHERGG